VGISTSEAENKN